jgi:hypothetical protein
MDVHHYKNCIWKSEQHQAICWLIFFRNLFRMSLNQMYFHQNLCWWNFFYINLYSVYWKKDLCIMDPHCRIKLLIRYFDMFIFLSAALLFEFFVFASWCNLCIGAFKFLNSVQELQLQHIELLFTIWCSCQPVMMETNFFLVKAFLLYKSALSRIMMELIYGLFIARHLVLGTFHELKRHFI